MNNQPVERINHHDVPTELKDELNDSSKAKTTETIQSSKHKLSNSKPPNGRLIFDTSSEKVPQSTSKRSNGDQNVDTIDNNLKFKKNHNCSTSYQNEPLSYQNETSSYQNDNSVYYTPVYKVNKNQSNINLKSLIESNDTQQTVNLSNVDCSFDNSIVPIASCSSMSSIRSSLSSNNIANTSNKTVRQKKSSSRKKDDVDQQTSSGEQQSIKKHPTNTKHHHSHHHHHRRRHQRNFRQSAESDYNNYHLESSNELNNDLPNIPSKLISSNPNHSINPNTAQFKSYHHQNQIIDHQNNNPMIDQAADLFDHHSIDHNSPLNTDEDSLPYFQTSSFNQDICNRLRWKLKYYFMNPLEKWRVKKKFPWKLLLQIIKIIFVTIHVLTYGGSMSRFLNHQGNMAISFRELLLMNWDPVREVMAYPPAAGAYAVYTIEDFYENFDFAIKNFAKITKQATGSFGYLTNNTDEVSPIEVCFKNYLNGTMDPAQFIYNYNNQIQKKCYILDSMGPAGSANWDKFSFEKYLNNRSISLDFDRIIEIGIKFRLRTIYLNSLELGSNPECYDVQIKINYDNSKHDGQVLIDLKAKSHLRECNGNLIDKVGVRLHKYEKTFLHVLVVILCLMSFTLCLRSLIKSHKLGVETKGFFKQHFRRHLTLEDQMEFYDFWIVMIIVNDIFIITGTILLQVQHVNTTNFDYTTCTIFLGVGIFLVWTGILRYLSFFKKYNVVILTAKRAFPDIFRFLICVLLLYCAFTLCGWIVLGPYHMKFRTLSKTSECLFSLLNGDDMFATFATTDTNENAIWLFSRLYLYGFITIFIYIILSLFISIIMDAYETIKECYITGMPLSDLHKFISECQNNAPDLNQREHRHSIFSFRNCIRSCCHCTDNSSSYEGL